MVYKRHEQKPSPLTAIANILFKRQKAFSNYRTIEDF